jgi:predicted Zn finger-like uncharacterized protein
MKIACQSCQAKYTIADEKVLGKIVKIRCKKCSATIVINGSDSPVGEIPASTGEQAFDYAGQGGGEQWTVNVADGDQRTMTTAELADAFRAGVVTDETYCWKDGMGDWLPLREIDGLHAAVTSAPRASAALLGDDGGGDDQATAIQMAPAALFSGTSPMPRPAAGAPAPATSSARENGGAAAQTSAAAARRAGPRPGPAADLFSAAASAGGEDDVMTSVPAGGIRPHDAGADKMTGQRNENSVLFSLSALTGGAPGSGAGGASSGGGHARSAVGAATSEASGLIDIRALASNMTAQQGPPKPNRVDDIMNLAGGGAFTPSLSAPILTAPPMDLPDFSASAPGSGGAQAMPGPGSMAPSNKKTWIIAGGVGGGVLLVAVIVVVALFAGGDKDKGTADVPSASASTPVATASAAPTASAVASAAPTASAVASAAPSASADEGDPNAPPLDMDSVKTTLKAAAGAVQGCSKPGGPTGKGKIVVVFKHSGAVDSAKISDAPYAGTPVGTCVEGKFFSSHIPKFSGSSPELGKSFTID